MRRGRLTGVDLAALPGDIDYYEARSDILTLAPQRWMMQRATSKFPPVGSGESRLVRMRGAKFFCDGAMGSWTAAMLRPRSGSAQQQRHIDLQREADLLDASNSVERCGPGLRPRHWGCGEPPDTGRSMRSLLSQPQIDSASSTSRSSPSKTCRGSPS